MMQPEGAPAQEQAPAQGGGASQLIQQTQAAMKKIGGLFEKAGLPTEGISQAIAAFEGAIEQAMGDGGEAPQQPGGVSSVEAGSNPNARPM